MLDFNQMILTFFFIVLAILCIFVAVHSSFQIKNLHYSFSTSSSSKKDKQKMIKILIISIVLFSVIFYRIVNNLSSHSNNSATVDIYKEKMYELNAELVLDVAMASDRTFSSTEEFALFLERHLPIKTLFYVEDIYGEKNELSSYEIMNYKLHDYQGKPTLVTYDGMLMSVIKFKEGCSYVNARQIAKSDCLLAVDLNHYLKPNQIGQDRVIFAIDGENKTVKVDSSFFR